MSRGKRTNMSDLESILKSINATLKTTSESVSKLQTFYEEEQQEKNTGVESLFKNDATASKERVSLLSLKNGAMLSYVNSLLMVAHDKMDPNCENPTAEKGRQLAIENRVVLERGVKPLEKKLSYQLDKLIRAYRRMEKEYVDAERRATERASTLEHGGSDAESGDSDSSDEDEEMSYRPNAIRSKTNIQSEKKSATNNNNEEHEEGQEQENDGIYRPPKISAMLPPTQASQHFEDKFNVKDHKDRSNKSRMQAMDEYLRDQSEQPDWESSIGANIVDHGRGGIKSLRDTEKERRVTDYEEDNFTRVNHMGKSKIERRKLKQKERAARVNIIGGEDFGIFNSKRKLEDSTSRRGNKRTKSAWERAKKRL